MPESIPLTPEAARIVAAFDAVMDRAGVFEGSNDALAAALRELVAVTKEAVSTVSTSNEWGDGYLNGLRDSVSSILAIADNIERAVTYAPTEPPTT